jgi:3-oxoacyl-[acyl-carrier-protein] synthase-1/3-oxoacyl-[acyl-carrier-protein] synthase II
VSRVAIVCVGAASGLGEGLGAASAGRPGERARIAITSDPELEHAGLGRPFAARVAGVRSDERATEILSRALAACAHDLDAAWPGWRGGRVGLALGTSSGGMRRAEPLFDGLAADASQAPSVEAESATYFGPIAAAARSMGIPFAPASLVLGACASSTFALGLGARWLEAGECEVVLAGGFDAVSVFVAAGFEVLRATSATVPPRPFRVGRDGMALGEGAIVMALTRADAAAARHARAYVSGFAATGDAVHLTAPDRTGAALARAGTLALREAGIAPDAVDLVSAHATATPFNDPAEARALARIFGEHAPVVVPLKAQIGHTLGAAGGLEALACVDAMARGVLPPTAGEGPLDPEASVRLLEVATPARVGAALKLSSAFGGANAALVLTRALTSSPRAVRPVYVTHAAHVTEGAPEATVEGLAALLGVGPERIARVDPLTRFALAAVAKLATTRAGALFAKGASEGTTGIVVGHSLATLETNARFQARIRERGPTHAEPRRFPYTSPNAVAGECSLAFGLTGPVFAVGGGVHGALEALGVAATLVGAGDAEQMLVVATDEIGPAARALIASSPWAAATWESGAIATVVSRRPTAGARRVARATLQRGRPARLSVAAVGHLALRPLAAPEREGPLVLESASPPDASARIELV